MAESTTPLEYYQSFTESPRLKDRFQNIDEDIYFQYLTLLQNVGTVNFALDFGNDDAWCALNLGEGDIALLLGRAVCLFNYISVVGFEVYCLLLTLILPETEILWDEMDVSR